MLILLLLLISLIRTHFDHFERHILSHIICITGVIFALFVPYKNYATLNVHYVYSLYSRLRFVLCVSVIFFLRKNIRWLNILGICVCVCAFIFRSFCFLRPAVFYLHKLYERKNHTFVSFGIRCVIELKLQKLQPRIALY